MKTLQQLASTRNIPTTAAWYLADLGEARGKQELFTKQSPQRLRVLREHALIESAVSSNRIEGVTVDQARVKNKDRYYETLEQSSQGWHEGQHDPWPYIGYIIYILKTAYREFDERVAEPTAGMARKASKKPATKRKKSAQKPRKGA